MSVTKNEHLLKEPRISDEKVFVCVSVIINEHFLKKPCVSNKKVFVCLSVTKNEHLLKEPRVSNVKVFACWLRKMSTFLKNPASVRKKCLSVCL